MCTRRPTHIRTAPADRWSCTVSLQQEYAYVKKKGPGQSFANWVAGGGMVALPFKTIDDKTELEEVLKWAHLALLNPNQDPQSLCSRDRQTRPETWGRSKHQGKVFSQRHRCRDLWPRSSQTVCVLATTVMSRKVRSPSFHVSSPFYSSSATSP